MNRKTLCILIALMVLSISALLVASPVWFISKKAEFGSTLNGVPVWVEFYVRGDKYLVKTMDIRELRKNRADHVGRFVRFTAVVGFVERDFQTGQVQLLTLGGNPYVEVYPLVDSQVDDSQAQHPETYERGQTYEFTGFLVRYEKHAPNQKSGHTILRIYTFEIRHLDEKENKK